jgi:hypothetical protein
MGTRHRLNLTIAAAWLGVMVLTACGDDSSATMATSPGSTVSPPTSTATSSGSTASPPTSTASTGVGVPGPCDLATADMVAAAFGGTSSAGLPGLARNCAYDIEGGSTARVDVYYYGTADLWDGIRAGFETNRGGTTDVSGIGSAAFYPGDAGPTELVVVAGDVVYSVSAGFNAGAEIDADVAALALAIASTVTG